MNGRRVLLVTVGALLLLAAGLHLFVRPLPALFAGDSTAGAAAPGAGARVGSDAPVPVETAKVERGRVAREITTVGTLRANQSVVIRSEIAGRVAELLFADGQSVEAGQALIVLDASVLQAELEQAQATLEMRRANAKRAAALLTRGAGTQQQRDETAAELRSDEATVKLAEAQLARTTIYAPFAGRLGFKQVEIGAVVQPGQDIVTLDSTQPLNVDFRVPEIYLAAVEVGEVARLETDAFPGRSFTATVSATDPQIEETGRSLLVRAVTPNPDGALRPGQFVTVFLSVEDRPDALLVPEAALVPEGGKQFVFRILDGKAARVEVELGLRQGAAVEVRRGLSAGDLVVVAGQEKLRDGSAVEAAASPAAAPAKTS